MHEKLPFGVDYVDLDSDHNLVWTEIQSPLKPKRKRGRRQRKRYLTEKLLPADNSPEARAEAESKAKEYEDTLDQTFGDYRPSAAAGNLLRFLAFRTSSSK